MITSFIEGRVRIRHDAFTDPEKANMITEMLEGYPGILNVTANTLTGSLLVLYDPEIISPEQLEQAEGMLKSFCGEEQPAKSLTSCCMSGVLDTILPRKKELFLLNATLGLCLIGIFGFWRVHVWAGSAFAALCIAHNLRRTR